MEVAGAVVVLSLLSSFVFEFFVLAVSGGDVPAVLGVCKALRLVLSAVVVVLSVSVREEEEEED